MKRKNNKGFTLVELLAVIVVLAIVMLVVADRVGDAMLQSRANSLALQIKSLEREVEKVCAMNNRITDTQINNIVKSGDLKYLGYENNIVDVDNDQLLDDVIYVIAEKPSKFSNIKETTDAMKLNILYCESGACKNTTGKKAVKGIDSSTKKQIVVNKGWLRSPSVFFKSNCPISNE